MLNPFFKNVGPFKIEKLLSKTDIENTENFKNDKVHNVSDLINATDKDLTFFHSKNYSSFASKTNASYCVTLESLSQFLPNTCKKIIVKNVLLSIAKITKEFYPESIVDDFDETAKDISKTSLKKKVKFGKNVLVGKNVKIGSNCTIGHNTIIEKYVRIGNNCNIGNNVIIKNSIIGNNTNILDGAVLGKKGFGFFPGKNSNTRYPHIGAVVVGSNVEIGCNNTIDRGSLSNTMIGDGTFLDNQVHVAHNVKIGKNCIITAQVGFAGSSSVGNKVLIGGQAGISGHLVIGDNVQIGGGSGVVKNIPSNTKVMGYPARNIRNFLKDNKFND